MDFFDYDERAYETFKEFERRVEKVCKDMEVPCPRAFAAFNYEVIPVKIIYMALIAFEAYELEYLSRGVQMFNMQGKSELNAVLNDILSAKLTVELMMNLTKNHPPQTTNDIHYWGLDDGPDTERLG